MAKGAFVGLPATCGPDAGRGRGAPPAGVGFELQSGLCPGFTVILSRSRTAA